MELPLEGDAPFAYGGAPKHTFHYQINGKGAGCERSDGHAAAGTCVLFNILKI
ncbi:MAG: hypothetical protein IRZ16_02440 [Myxococcaceae bacterium]|nr:hypothetical protein [Myxococcaceae bacterium]